jgi:TolB-like protein
LRTLASGLAEDIRASGKKTIAVVDFTDLQGNPTELGRYLAEELSVAMARTHKGFEVIDRAHLKALLTEHKLAASGLIDPATAKKLGQISGADVLLTGSMTPFSESVRVAVKALATDTARIIGADTIDLPKTTTISELLGNSRAREVPQRLPSAVPSTLSATLSGSSGGPTQSSPVVVEGQFQYELMECRGMANSVKCSFRITNRGPDRELIHFCGRTLAGRNTTAFDNSGNESYAETCAIGNHDSNSGFAAGISVTANLISGVPVVGWALFPHLGASASSVSLLTIVGLAVNGGGQNTNTKAAFRNVPIVR